MAINLRMTPDLTHLSTVVGEFFQHQTCKHSNVYLADTYPNPDPHSNPVTLKRADAMTYDEAVHYYRTEHPYGPRLSASSTSTDRDRHVRDLPI